MGEVTTGCKTAVSYSLSLPVIAGISGFGGFAVICQCASYSNLCKVKMKYLIGRVFDDYKARYVQTISEDAEQLNKWHEFLGFKKEKVLPNYRRGKDFIVWSM